VLDLRSQDHVEAAGEQGVPVLEEAAVDLLGMALVTGRDDCAAQDPVARGPEARAPDHLVAAAEHQVMLPVEVDRAAEVLEGRQVAVAAVDVRAEDPSRVRPEAVRPRGPGHADAGVRPAIDPLVVRRRERPRQEAPVGFPPDTPRAERELVLLAQGVVGPQMGAPLGPVVPGFRSGERPGIAREPAARDTIRPRLAQPAAVAELREPALLRSAPRADIRSRGLARRPCDDVDHPVDRVRSPEASARAPDDLDPFNVLEDEVLGVPVDPGERRGVHGAAVDQDEELVRETAVAAARADRPLVRVDRSDLDSRHLPEQIGDVPGAGTADVLRRDDGDGGRRVEDRL